MELIYSNFDGLDVSFQGAFPEAILQQLEHGRNEAERVRREVVIYLGEDKIPVQIAETGAKGGFRYRFDTGLDRETWFVANSTNPEQWNIRVSVKSMALALHGYTGVKENILNTLLALGAYGPDIIDPITGQIFNLPKERVSRFDVCFDFETENFTPNPEHLITHNRSKRKMLFEKNNLSEGETVFQGRNLIYLRVGQMPNRQIVFYNKTKEITEKSKKWWFKVWGINPDEFNKSIWRIETRAGKKELNKWNIRTFDDFEKKSGDVITSILEENRYVIPNNDKNTSRWPNAPFWEQIINSAYNNFSNYISNANKGEIINAAREEIKERYRSQLIGMAAPYSYICGNEDITQIPRVFDSVQADIDQIRHTSPHILHKKIDKAKNKFVFIEEKKGGN